MPVAPRLVRPTHRHIVEYYRALEGFRVQGVAHEQAVRSAFQSLLTEAAKPFHWIAIPELGRKTRGTRVVPDGTLRDGYHLPRGYWEAKDIADDLDDEIAAKIEKGYPTNNIVFWTPDRAILVQDAQRKLDVSIRDDGKGRAALCDVLNALFSYVDKPILEFDRAVQEFTERVPEIGGRLAEIIADAHESNRAFRTAFAAFLDLCRVSLNPNIAETAVDEMLIQHLLTERLFKTVFKNPEFVRKNVIASEVEKVIDALSSRSFTREEFLKALDRFYVAIENAAAGIVDFADKQHFLNSVYERFFQGYCVKTADTHGIIYTPQQIVDFMCASIEHVLREEFGKNIGDDGVIILDPCTGTGNFVVNLMRRAAARSRQFLQRMYRDQLFANEVMLMPYYIAALNIEHAYFEEQGSYEPFDGLCFVDTLGLAEPKDVMFSEKNAERVKRQKKAPITVVIGNPPYNMGQLDENDNNKNRRYKVVDDRVRATYSKSSTSTLRTKLYDPYVKFFRWATDRLQDRDGIVCFVSNNSFVENVAFDGMRKHLAKEFQTIYHIDLEGNVRHDPKLAGSQYNVFGIQVGVGITIAIRRKGSGKSIVRYAKADKSHRRFEKLAWLQERESVKGIQWSDIAPDAAATWISVGGAETFGSWIRIVGDPHATGDAREGAFATYLLGVNTARDQVVYDFGRDVLAKRIESTCEALAMELTRLSRKAPGSIDDDAFDYTKIKWSQTLKGHVRRGTLPQCDGNKIVEALYRPFCKKWLYYDRVLVDRPSHFDRVFSKVGAEGNQVLGFTAFGAERPFMTLVSNRVSDLHVVGAGSGLACVPLWMHGEGGQGRVENVTDWMLRKTREHYGDENITKRDIFHYVYAILHHEGYRVEFAPNLKRELPRIPLAPAFHEFARAGARLAELHLGYDDPVVVAPFKLKEVWAPGTKKSHRAVRPVLARNRDEVLFNDSLTLSDLPADVLNYRLGNRSALEWVLDQYQITTDERDGSTSDPNLWGEDRNDDEYIVRLIKQVVTVSLETNAIVRSLPKPLQD